MTVDPNLLWAIIGIGSGLGGMLSALVGYYGSDEQFSPRKFAAGIIRGFFTGVLSFIAFLSSNQTISVDGMDFTFMQLLQEIPSLAILIAVLAGYAGDSIGNKLSGMIGAKRSESKQ